MTFEWPAALAGLLLLPLAVGALAWWERRRRASQAAFGNPDLLPNVVDGEPGRLRYLPTAVFLAAFAAMVVGVARPHATVSVPREEAVVVLAIDVSRSMKATDVEPTRLEAARALARAFVAELLPRYRVGIVSFATRAAVALPPTEDRALVEDALEALSPGEGTAIGDAVALALELGATSPPRAANAEREEGGEPPPRTILVLSDGARDGGLIDPTEAAKRAREQGVPVHAVLVGTPAGVVEERLLGGFTRIIRVPSSPQTLERLASTTGGRLFRTLDAAELRPVHEELGSRLGTRRERREITDLFAAGAAALLALGAGLSALVSQRVL
ncbi:MAG: VWA domain-containing protein [Thermoleophilia bacterium]|nr:VWA domain-containing protein [Thermoleophilia bacterium]